MAKGKILIIDDEPDVREVLKLYLESGGFHVIEAENGEVAINTLRSGDNMVNVGAILCDIRMPKVNGLECIDFFCKEAPGIPVVVVTGFTDTELATSLLGKGCKGYLVKPVPKDKLVQTVKKVISEKKGVDL